MLKPMLWNLKRGPGELYRIEGRDKSFISANVACSAELRKMTGKAPASVKPFRQGNKNQDRIIRAPPLCGRVTLICGHDVHDCGLYYGIYPARVQGLENVDLA